MTMLSKKNIYIICVSVLIPLFFVVIQYFSLLAIKYFGFHSLVSFLIVGSFNLFVIFLACKKFDIRLNQSNVLLQLKSGFIISGFGLLSLMFAYFILKISSDISIWELFRGEERSGLNVSYRVLYLFTIALFAPFYEEVYFRAFTLSVLDNFTPKKPLFYYLGRSSGVVSFVLAHVLSLGFSFWNVVIWAICGVITTILYDYYKGYWAGFVVHALANTVMVLLFWRFI